MWRFFTFLKDESGATSIEYALIASLIGIVIVSAVSTTGQKTSRTFSKVASALS